MGERVRPLRFTEVVNPFKPEERREFIVTPRPGEMLDATMRRIGISADDCVLQLNGEMVRESEAAYELVRPGDAVVYTHVPQGGALKTIASIAVVAASIAAPFTFGLTGIAAAALGAAISIGGNMLISATMGSGNSTGGQPGVTYDPNGPKSLAQPGTPVPKGYGTMGWGGNIISSFVDQDGADEYLNILVSFGFGTAVAISDILLNGKPIGSFADLGYAVRLGTNDQTVMGGFSRVENVYPQETELLAANGPVVVTGTGTGVTGLVVSVKFPGGLMRTDSSGNPKECSFAYLTEVSPSGQNQWTTPIFPRANAVADVKTTDSNGYQHYPYWVVLPTDRYAGSGIVYSTDTDEGAHYEGEIWAETEHVTTYDINNNQSNVAQLFQGEWHAMNVNEDFVSVTAWNAGYSIVSNMTDQSFYNVINIYGLTPGQWDVRVTKYGAGPHNQPIPQGDGYMTDPHYTADGWLWDIAEITYADLAYPNMILLGIRAMATSQLSGQNVTVLATIQHDIGEDTVLPPELAGYRHDNPAVVAYDIIANPLYGMGQAQMVDLPSFVQWADFCDEQVPLSAGGTGYRFTFAGVFDSTSNCWTSLQQVANMARAQILQLGNKYSVWMDAPTDVTQVFTDANIKKGSFSETFVAFDDRANQLEVEFADAARNFRTDLPVSVQTAATLNGGYQAKTTRTRLLGCTSRDQAWQWAYFHLLSTETLPRTAKWECGIEAISCNVGSVVGVQQSQWAYSGRAVSGSGTALVIDRSDLPFAINEGWTIAVSHVTLSRGTATIQSITPSGSSQLVTFSSALPAGRILKIVSAAGVEARISVGQTGGANGNVGTIAGNVTGFAAGSVVTLYDQDTVDTIPVTALQGNTVTLASALSSSLGYGACFVYGQSGGAAPYKLFRVQQIRQTSDYSMQIDALEYNALIYEDNTPAYGENVGIPTISADVTNITLVEKFQQTSIANKSASQSIISVNWDNGPNTVGAIIYGAVDGGAERLLADVTGTGWSFPASPADTWVIRVVGRDALGAQASHATAPTATITVDASSLAPGDIAGFYVISDPGLLGLYWTMAPGYTYEIRYNTDAKNTNWNTGTVMITGLANLPGHNIVAPGAGVYMIKSILKGVYSLSSTNFALTQSTSSLNGVGSVLPGQSLLVNATVTATSSTLNMPAQALARTDGTSLTVNAGTVTLSGLASGTTYYIYTFLSLTDNTLGTLPLGATPSTTPNPTYALQAAADGRLQGPTLIVTTGTTGTGGTGGTGGSYTGGSPGTCPDGRELVDTLERGIVAVSTVVEGEHLRGYCFQVGQSVYRKVVRAATAHAWAWYTVEGYRMSPIDPVFLAGEWRMPYQVGEPDHGDGARVQITVEADRYDQHNYYLVGRDEPLLIHNLQVAAC